MSEAGWRGVTVQVQQAAVHHPLLTGGPGEGRQGVGGHVVRAGADGQQSLHEHRPGHVGWKGMVVESKEWVVGWRWTSSVNLKMNDSPVERERGKGGRMGRRGLGQMGFEERYSAIMVKERLCDWVRVREKKDYTAVEQLVKSELE